MSFEHSGLSLDRRNMDSGASNRTKKSGPQVTNVSLCIEKTTKDSMSSNFWKSKNAYNQQTLIALASLKFAEVVECFIQMIESIDLPNNASREMLAGRSAMLPGQASTQSMGNSGGVAHSSSSTGGFEISAPVTNSLVSTASGSVAPVDTRISPHNSILGSNSALNAASSALAGNVNFGSAITSFTSKQNVFGLNKMSINSETALFQLFYHCIKQNLNKFDQISDDSISRIFPILLSLHNDDIPRYNSPILKKYVCKCLLILSRYFFRPFFSIIMNRLNANLLASGNKEDDDETFDNISSNFVDIKYDEIIYFLGEFHTYCEKRKTLKSIIPWKISKILKRHIETHTKDFNNHIRSGGSKQLNKIIDTWIMYLYKIIDNSSKMKIHVWPLAITLLFFNPSLLASYCDLSNTKKIDGKYTPILLQVKKSLENVKSNNWDAAIIAAISFCKCIIYIEPESRIKFNKAFEYFMEHLKGYFQNYFKYNNIIGDELTNKLLYDIFKIMICSGSVYELGTENIICKDKSPYSLSVQITMVNAIAECFSLDYQPWWIDLTNYVSQIKLNHRFIQEVSEMNMIYTAGTSSAVVTANPEEGTNYSTTTLGKKTGAGGEAKSYSNLTGTTSKPPAPSLSEDAMKMTVSMAQNIQSGKKKARDPALQQQYDSAVINNAALAGKINSNAPMMAASITASINASAMSPAAVSNMPTNASGQTLSNNLIYAILKIFKKAPACTFKRANGAYNYDFSSLVMSIHKITYQLASPMICTEAEKVLLVIHRPDNMRFWFPKATSISCLLVGSISVSILGRSTGTGNSNNNYYNSLMDWFCMLFQNKYSTFESTKEILASVKLERMIVGTAQNYENLLYCLLWLMDNSLGATKVSQCFHWLAKESSWIRYYTSQKSSTTGGGTMRKASERSSEDSPGAPASETDEGIGNFFKMIPIFEKLGECYYKQADGGNATVHHRLFNVFKRNNNNHMSPKLFEAYLLALKCLCSILVANELYIPTELGEMISNVVIPEMIQCRMELADTSNLLIVFSNIANFLAANSACLVKNNQEKLVNTFISSIFKTMSQESSSVIVSSLVSVLQNCIVTFLSTDLNHIVLRHLIDTFKDIIEKNNFNTFKNVYTSALPILKYVLSVRITDSTSSFSRKPMPKASVGNLNVATGSSRTSVRLSVQSNPFAGGNSLAVATKSEALSNADLELLIKLAINPAEFFKNFVLKESFIKTNITIVRDILQNINMDTFTNYIQLSNKIVQVVLNWFDVYIVKKINERENLITVSILSEYLSLLLQDLMVDYVAHTASFTGQVYTNKNDLLTVITNSIIFLLNVGNALNNETIKKSSKEALVNLSLSNLPFCSKYLIKVLTQRKYDSKISSDLFDVLSSVFLRNQPYLVCGEGSGSLIDLLNKFKTELFKPDHDLLMYLLTKVLPDERKDDFLFHIVDIFANGRMFGEDQFVSFMVRVFDEEVNFNEFHQTLFRATGLGMMLLNVCLRTFGAEIGQLLSEPIIRIILNKGNNFTCEIDPHKNNNSDDIKRNVLILTMLVKLYLNDFFEVFNQVKKNPLFLIFRALYISILKKFPDYALVSVGSIFFLRHLIPSLYSSLQTMSENIELVEDLQEEYANQGMVSISNSSSNVSQLGVFDEKQQHVNKKKSMYSKKKAGSSHAAANSNQHHQQQQQHHARVSASQLANNKGVLTSSGNAAGMVLNVNTSFATGIENSPVFQQRKRVVTLLSKILQNIANNLVFSKEKHMLVFNDLVITLAPKIKEIMSEIVERQIEHVPAVNLKKTAMENIPVNSFLDLVTIITTINVSSLKDDAVLEDTGSLYSLCRDISAEYSKTVLSNKSRGTNSFSNSNNASFKKSCQKVLKDSNAVQMISLAELMQSFNKIARREDEMGVIEEMLTFASECKYLLVDCTFFDNYKDLQVFLTGKFISEELVNMMEASSVDMTTVYMVNPNEKMVNLFSNANVLCKKVFAEYMMGVANVNSEQIFGNKIKFFNTIDDCLENIKKSNEEVNVKNTNSCCFLDKFEHLNRKAYKIYEIKANEESTSTIRLYISLDYILFVNRDNILLKVMDLNDVTCATTVDQTGITLNMGNYKVPVKFVVTNSAVRNELIELINKNCKKQTIINENSNSYYYLCGQCTALSIYSIMSSASLPHVSTAAGNLLSVMNEIFDVNFISPEAATSSTGMICENKLSLINATVLKLEQFFLNANNVNMRNVEFYLQGILQNFFVQLEIDETLLMSCVTDLRSNVVNIIQQFLHYLTRNVDEMTIMLMLTLYNFISCALNSNLVCDLMFERKILDEIGQNKILVTYATYLMPNLRQYIFNIFNDLDPRFKNYYQIMSSMAKTQASVIEKSISTIYMLFYCVEANTTASLKKHTSISVNNTSATPVIQTDETNVINSTTTTSTNTTNHEPPTKTMIDRKSSMSEEKSPSLTYKFNMTNLLEHMASNINNFNVYIVSFGLKLLNNVMSVTVKMDTHHASMLSSVALGLMAVLPGSSNYIIDERLDLDEIEMLDLLKTCLTNLFYVYKANLTDTKQITKMQLFEQRYLAILDESFEAAVEISNFASKKALLFAPGISAGKQIDVVTQNAYFLGASTGLLVHNPAYKKLITVLVNTFDNSKHDFKKSFFKYTVNDMGNSCSHNQMYYLQWYMYGLSCASDDCVAEINRALFLFMEFLEGMNIRGCLSMLAFINIRLGEVEKLSKENEGVLGRIFWTLMMVLGIGEILFYEESLTLMHTLLLKMKQMQLLNEYDKYMLKFLSDKDDLYLKFCLYSKTLGINIIEHFHHAFCCLVYKGNYCNQTAHYMSNINSTIYAIFDLLQQSVSEPLTRVVYLLSMIEYSKQAVPLLNDCISNITVNGGAENTAGSFSNSGSKSYSIDEPAVAEKKPKSSVSLIKTMNNNFLLFVLYFTQILENAITTCSEENLVEIMRAYIKMAEMYPDMVSLEKVVLTPILFTMMAKLENPMLHELITKLINAINEKIASGGVAVSPLAKNISKLGWNILSNLKFSGLKNALTSFSDRSIPVVAWNYIGDISLILTKCP